MTSQPTPPVRISIIVWWYVATFAASAVLLLTQQLTHIDPLYISIVQFAPTIALLALPSARRAAASATHAIPRAAFIRHLLLAVVVSGVFFAGIVMFAVLTGTERYLSPFPSIGALALYLVLQFVGAMGEEIGWRGFLQPALETRISGLAAAASVGVLWSVWHVQMFTDALTGFAFVVSCVAMSVLFSWFARGSVWQRALIGGLMHFAVNVTLLFAFAVGGSVLGSMTVAVTITGVGLAVRAMRRRVVDIVFTKVVRQASGSSRERCDKHPDLIRALCLSRSLGVARPELQKSSPKGLTRIQSYSYSERVEKYDCIRRSQCQLHETRTPWSGSCVIRSGSRSAWH